MAEEPAGRRRLGRMLLIGATGIVAGGAAWLLASLLVGAPNEGLDHGLVPGLCAALVGAAVALALAERAAGGLRAALRGEHAGREALKEELERTRREGDERLVHERRARALVERSRQAERGWSSELRSQIVALHRQRVPLSRGDDARAMVLQVALALLEADKGLLLTPGRSEEAAGLELVCAEGFDHDPDDSAIARSFAGRVIKRDETLRENDSRSLDRQGRTPADDEIERTSSPSPST